MSERQSHSDPYTEQWDQAPNICLGSAWAYVLGDLSRSEVCQEFSDQLDVDANYRLRGKRNLVLLVPPQLPHGPSAFQPSSLVILS